MGRLTEVCGDLQRIKEDKKKGTLRFPENIDNEPYLSRRKMPARALHAGAQQALLQSGSCMYPLVELVHGRLLAHAAYVAQGQFAFAVSAYRKTGFYVRVIYFFHIHIFLSFACAQLALYIRFD